MALKIGNTTVGDPSEKIDISNVDPTTIPSSFVSPSWLLNGVSLIPSPSNGPFTGAAINKIYSIRNNVAGEEGILRIEYTTNCNCKCKCQCKCKCKCKCLCACKCQCKCKCACKCLCKCRCKCFNLGTDNDGNILDQLSLEKIKSLQQVIMSYMEKGLDFEEIIDTENDVAETTLQLLENFCQDVEEILPDLINIVDISETKLKAIKYIEKIPKIIEEFQKLDNEE